MYVYIYIYISISIYIYLSISLSLSIYIYIYMNERKAVPTSLDPGFLMVSLFTMHADCACMPHMI